MVHGLRTPWGPLGYMMKIDGRTVTLRIDSRFNMPPKGIVVQTPFGTAFRTAVVDGVTVQTDVRGNGSFALTKPAHEIVLTYP